VAAEAKRRLEEVGPNVLDRASGEGAWGILWRQVNDPLIWVLLASAAVALNPWTPSSCSQSSS
jgi:hypothetical protein